MGYENRFSNRDLKTDLDLVIGSSDLSLYEDSWLNNVVNPFSDAYETAYDSFKKYQKLDDDAAKAKRELAFAALSLVGGSVLTQVLGKLTFQDAAKNFAINTICNNNMNRAFNAANIVASSPGLSFILGQGLTGTGAWMKSQTKAMFDKSAFTAAQTTLDKPSKIRSSLTQLVQGGTLRLRWSVKDLRDSGKLNNSLKKIELSKIMLSPFCKAPRTNTLVGGLAEKIELGFYMKMIMDSDSFADINGRGRKTSSHKISQLTSDPSYPTNSVGSNRNRKQVLYDHFGENVVARLNQLYIKHGNGNSTALMTSDIPNAAILKEAEIVLVKIGEETVANIRRFGLR